MSIKGIVLKVLKYEYKRNGILSVKVKDKVTHAAVIGIVKIGFLLDILYYINHHYHLPGAVLHVH